MRTVIVISDVHLGGRYCRVDRFLKFLNDLPDDAALLLNGDIADAHRYPFRDPRMRSALERLIAESGTRPITWIRGNNDRDLALTDSGNITFVEEAMPAPGVWVTHGHRFDRTLHHDFFSVPFRILYRLGHSLGLARMDVATYTKSRWRRLYEALSRRIIRRAVRYTIERGYHTLICGHLHRSDDQMVDGVRYMNTGSWTEPDEHCVVLTDDACRLVPVDACTSGGVVE